MTEGLEELVESMGPESDDIIVCWDDVRQAGMEGARDSEIFIDLSLVLAIRRVRDSGVKETAPVTQNRGIAGWVHGAYEQTRRNVNLKAQPLT